MNFDRTQPQQAFRAHRNGSHWRSMALAVLFLLILANLYVWMPTFASGPSNNRVLNYQLRLTDGSGIPVADGTQDIKISFYVADSGGTPVYTDCGLVGTPVGRKVIFTNGVGSVLIGDQSPS